MSPGDINPFESPPPDFLGEYTQIQKLLGWRTLELTEILISALDAQLRRDDPQRTLNNELIKQTLGILETGDTGADGKNIRKFHLLAAVGDCNIPSVDGKSAIIVFGDTRILASTLSAIQRKMRSSSLEPTIVSPEGEIANIHQLETDQFGGLTILIRYSPTGVREVYFFTNQKIDSNTTEGAELLKFLSFMGLIFDGIWDGPVPPHLKLQEVNLDLFQDSPSTANIEINYRQRLKGADRLTRVNSRRARIHERQAKLKRN